MTSFQKILICASLALGVGCAGWIIGGGMSSPPQKPEILQIGERVLTRFCKQVACEPAEFGVPEYQEGDPAKRISSRVLYRLEADPQQFVEIAVHANGRAEYAAVTLHRPDRPR